MLLLLIIALSAGANIAVAEWERDIEGKLAVITGAAQGIGFAIADNFLENGARKIVIVDKNYTKGFQAEYTLKCKYGENAAEYIRGDVTTDLEVLFKMITEKNGYVDVLVNAAGVADETNVRKTIATNTISTIEWSLKFGEQMRKDRGGKGGTIINIASISGFTIDPFLVTYKASKSAVIGFSQGLGHPYNYRKSGVRVYTICPGRTRTALETDWIAWPEQTNLYRQFLNSNPIQPPDVLGKAAVVLFKTADSGTAWEVNNRTLSVAPDSAEITLSDIDRLLWQSVSREAANNNRNKKTNTWLNRNRSY